jgi:hypothetical protein
MKIQDVLGPTGRAEAVLARPDWYIKTKENCEYFWYRKDTNEVIRELTVNEALGYVWQPYHEVKEIRPENEDEVWFNSHVEIYYLYSARNKELVTARKIALDKALMTEVVHGKNNWTREIPKVEEVWGKSAIQDDIHKKAQIYAIEVARQALEFLDEIEKDISPASISSQLAASSLRGVSVDASKDKSLVDQLEETLISLAGDNRECPQCRHCFIPNETTSQEALRLFNLLFN